MYYLDYKMVHMKSLLLFRYLEHKIVNSLKPLSALSLKSSDIQC